MMEGEVGVAFAGLLYPLLQSFTGILWNIFVVLWKTRYHTETTCINRNLQHKSDEKLLT